MSADPITDDLRDHYSELSSGYGLWVLGCDSIPVKEKEEKEERAE